MIRGVVLPISTNESTMEKSSWLQSATHILLALAVSGLVIAFLAHSSRSAADASLLPRLFTVTTSVSTGSLLLYLLASCFRTIVQTVRYSLILKTMEPVVPNFFHLLLITISRNMFVDMLPSRLGELSYAAMLNRGHAINLASCLSSLAIGFVFDLGALAIIILGIVWYQMLLSGIQMWLIGALLTLILVVAIALALLFPVLPWYLNLLETVVQKMGGRMGRVLGRFTSFLAKTISALDKARHAGIVGRLLLLSLAGRMGKYLGLYALFLGVVTAAFPDVNTNPLQAVVALISAEAGASMPLPGFMGFGAYEAAGMLAMVALGANQAAAFAILLSLHLLSQVMDYGVGVVALITFFMTTRTMLFRTTAAAPARCSWYTLVTLVLFVVAAVLLTREAIGIRNLGSFRPPDSGQETYSGNKHHKEDLSTTLSGFIVWSSNRSGNHDIWMMTLPDQTLRQLTTNPHTESYPRVSPEGTQVVFARSREPWVSQRNDRPWNVMLLDLRTGEERLLAEFGNAPTWSADGRSVYFQRNSSQIVQLTLATRNETVVLDSGRLAGLKPSVVLQTPSVAPDGRTIAVTLRGGMRATAVIGPERAVRTVGDGCQLNWSPDGSFLLKVDHGGKQVNAIYRLDPKTMAARLWFDAPGAYSHEYFPKLANTGDVLVYGASSGGHEHDTADYEIFLWRIDRPPAETLRLTHHTGNDCWPDIFLNNTNP